jgi:hypothetical protein
LDLGDFCDAILYIVEHPLSRDISHIKLTAILAVVVLVGVGIWQGIEVINERNVAGTFVATAGSGDGAQNAAGGVLGTTTAGDSDPISAVSNNAIGEVVGAYTGLQENGQYSSTTAAELAGTIGLGLETPVSYAPIDASQIKTSPDTSYNAMMQYRASLQTSLKPLLNNTEPEYEIFGMYVETKQQTYLDQLQAAAANYVAAASSTAALTVPADAVQVQLGLVNSMYEFAATVNDLADHAGDPIASSVLLENYNQAENDVLSAFQALVTCEQSKTQ